MRIFWLMMIFLLSACSTTVMGPITGRQYNIDVGCTDNMKASERERESVVSTDVEASPAEAKLDCPTAPAPQP